MLFFCLRHYTRYAAVFLLYLLLPNTVTRTEVDIDTDDTSLIRRVAFATLPSCCCFRDTLLFFFAPFFTPPLYATPLCYAVSYARRYAADISLLILLLTIRFFLLFSSLIFVLMLR